MKITFLQTGRTTDKRLLSLIDDYASRVSHYIPFEVVTIPELKNTKALSEAVQREREGDLILKQLRASDHVVLLDEAGREMRSVDFAAYIDRLQVQSLRRVVFIIGGPYGFSPAVYAAAREKVSLSQMTFSHQMVRLFFVEQLYRAMTILRGEPYHHE